MNFQVQFLALINKKIPVFAGMTIAGARPTLADEAKPCLSTDKPVCRLGRGSQESLF
ncbi:MAG: hypothetical protein ACK43K_05255 [Chitinophagales bacterium]|nr:hypothetical protein [Sphingobacteriales bacterium]